MNLFDGLVVVALVAGAAWGFMKGVVHQIIGIGLLYIGVVAATWGYPYLAPSVARLMKLGIAPAGAISFLFLTIVTINVIGFALRDARKKEYKVLRLVNQLGGMTFGFVMASVWVAIGIAMLYFAATGSGYTAPNTGAPVFANVGGWEATRQSILNGLRHSPLVGAFSVLLPMILSSVAPIVPADNVVSIFVIR